MLATVIDVPTMEVLILLLEECAQPKISIVFFRQDRSYDEIITVISRGHETRRGSSGQCDFGCCVGRLWCWSPRMLHHAVYKASGCVLFFVVILYRHMQLTEAF